MILRNKLDKTTIFKTYGNLLPSTECDIKNNYFLFGEK